MEIKIGNKAISATVVGIILIIVGLAIAIMFIMFAGKSGQGGIFSMIDTIDILKRGK